MDNGCPLSGWGFYEHQLGDAWNSRSTPTAEAVREASEALRACRDRFQEYVNSHAAKGTPGGWEKAARNQDMVRLCDKALAAIDLPGGGE